MISGQRDTKAAATNPSEGGVLPDGSDALLPVLCPRFRIHRQCCAQSQRDRRVLFRLFRLVLPLRHARLERLTLFDFERAVDGVRRSFVELVDVERDGGPLARLYHVLLANLAVKDAARWQVVRRGMRIARDVAVEVVSCTRLDRKHQRTLYVLCQS